MLLCACINIRAYGTRLPLCHTHACTFSFCVGGSDFEESQGLVEESQGGTATATSLLDAPKLSELGIINFFGIMITIVSIIPYILEKCGIE